MSAAAFYIPVWVDTSLAPLSPAFLDLVSPAYVCPSTQSPRSEIFLDEDKDEDTCSPGLLPELSTLLTLLPYLGYDPGDYPRSQGARHGRRGTFRGADGQAPGHALLRGAVQDLRGAGCGGVGAPVPPTILRRLRRVQGG